MNCSGTALNSSNQQMNRRQCASEVPNSQYHGGNTQFVGRFFINDAQTIRGSYQRRRAAGWGNT